MMIQPKMDHRGIKLDGVYWYMVLDIICVIAYPLWKPSCHLIGREAKANLLIHPLLSFPVYTNEHFPTLSSAASVLDKETLISVGVRILGLPAWLFSLLLLYDSRITCSPREGVMSIFTWSPDVHQGGWVSGTNPPIHAYAHTTQGSTKYTLPFLLTLTPSRSILLTLGYITRDCLVLPSSPSQQSCCMLRFSKTSYVRVQ